MPNRHHQRELWDPPQDKKPPKSQVFGSRTSWNEYDDQEQEVWDPQAICDGRLYEEDGRPHEEEAAWDSGDYDCELTGLTGGGRSKFAPDEAASSSGSIFRRILCCLAFSAAAGYAAYVSKARLLPSPDSKDVWDGRRPNVPVVLQQDNGFLSIGPFADSGETNILVAQKTSDSSIWLPVEKDGRWVFRSKSLLRISENAKHPVDGEGYWYLSKDCRARNWADTTELFSLTKLGDGAFSFDGMSAACGTILGVKPYQDCTSLVTGCLERCASKFGETIAEGNARYCAKGCAITKGTEVVSAEALCYVPREVRQSTCMDRCDHIVDKDKMVPKCQYGCGFWSSK